MVGVLAAVYVGTWVAYLVYRYRYIRDCPVPLWSKPWAECFQCPHASRCGRTSSLYRQWERAIMLLDRDGEDGVSKKVPPER